MTTHELKCWPVFFNATRSGHKNFELRVNDRDFKVGDIVRLEEWSPDTGYTGRSLIRNIRYVLGAGEIDAKTPREHQGFKVALHPDYVILAL